MTGRIGYAALAAGVSLWALCGVAAADPPLRAGRVGVIEGGVSLLPAGGQSWIWAALNYPVSAGVSLWTGDDGRAQVQLGEADARLDVDTELDALDLDYGETRIGLPQGSADLRLWTAPRGGLTVSTPAGDLKLDTRGRYRVDVRPPAAYGQAPQVVLTVFEGWAEVPSPDGVQAVQAGQSAALWPGYAPQLGQAQRAPIDDWARRLDSQTAQRVDDDDAGMPGYADLYPWGDFAQDPAYGRVWYPRDVDSDWAPYRFGHWANVEPWGYTWIDDAPWGFAPFHFGRWARIGGRWAWVPGQGDRERVYAPALVTFLNVGVEGAIAWAPLAPDELYRPAYRFDHDDYWRRLNRGAVRSETSDYRSDFGRGEHREGEAPPRNAAAITGVRLGVLAGGDRVQDRRLSNLPSGAGRIAAVPPAPSAATRPAPIVGAPRRPDPPPGLPPAADHGGPAPPRGDGWPRRQEDLGVASDWMATHPRPQPRPPVTASPMSMPPERPQPPVFPPRDAPRAIVEPQPQRPVTPTAPRLQPRPPVTSPPTGGEPDRPRPPTSSPPAAAAPAGAPFPPPSSAPPRPVGEPQRRPQPTTTSAPPRPEDRARKSDD